MGDVIEENVRCDARSGSWCTLVATTRAYTHRGSGGHDPRWKVVYSCRACADRSPGYERYPEALPLELKERLRTIKAWESLTCECLWYTVIPNIPEKNVAFDADPGVETTEFILQFRVTKKQLDMIEWMRANLKFSNPPSKELTTPEEWLAYRLLPELAKVFAEGERLRARHEADRLLDK